jgi:capsular polysaccharide transport system permease protein
LGEKLLTQQARTDRLARLFPQVDVGPRRPYWRSWGRASMGWLVVPLLLLPTILAMVYYGLLADDRYVSEARFLVRSAARPTASLGGIASLLELAGISRSQDDAFAIRDFMLSRDALHQLGERLDLRHIYAHRDADLLTSYPSPLYRSTQEGLYSYYKQRLSVIVNIDSGLTTMKVEAFRPEDAHAVAATLMDLGEHLVNQLNDRMRTDTIRVAEDEVARARERRIKADLDLTAFRNRELMLDPVKSSAMVLQVIGHLATQEAELRAQIAAVQSAAPTSPQLPPLLDQASAVHHEIEKEQDRVGSNSDGLADKVSAYEGLVLEQDFATRMLSQAMAAVDAARNEARRQTLFLERVVEPGTPDEAIRPQRIVMVLTVFGFNLLGVGLFWLLGTGLREHAAGTQLTWMRSRTR